jgi:hypothetical protein
MIAAKMRHEQQEDGVVRPMGGCLNLSKREGFDTEQRHFCTLHISHTLSAHHPGPLCFTFSEARISTRKSPSPLELADGPESPQHKVTDRSNRLRFRLTANRASFNDLPRSCEKISRQPLESQTGHTFRLGFAPQPRASRFSKTTKKD